MKKVISMVMCLALLFTAFAGCGSSTASQSGGQSGGQSGAGSTQNVTLTFWKSPHSDHEEAIWAKIIEKFNKENPNITVQFLSVPWDSVNQKEQAAFASDTPPDISFQVEQYPVYAAAGKLVDLNKYMTDQEKAGYPKPALDYCTYNGKLMGRPFIALDSVVFYNKDIFQKEGLTVPKTWDEYVKTAQKATKDTNNDGKVDQYGLLLETKPSIDLWQAFTFIAQAGGDLWDKDLTNVGFNNEAGVKGLQFYTDLYRKYKVCPDIDTFSSVEQERDAFYKGKVAMYPAQIQFSGNIKATAPNLNYGAFLVPSGPAADKAHSGWNFANIGMLSIASASKHVEEAWKFIDFVTKPENEKDYLSEVGFFSPQLSTNDLMYKNDPVMSVAAEGIKNLQVSPASKNFQGMYDGLKTMFESCIRGTATPQQAINALSDKMKEIS